MVSDQHNDSILILDFGSQVTQLIARRVRESGIYSEIFPFSKADEAIKKLKPKGIILSGGPASVNNQDAPTIDDKIFDLKIPILGICYGQQIMCSLLGGEVEKSNEREFGRANIKFLKSSPLFEGFDIKGNTEPVWMSHGDKVTSLPKGFEVIAESKNAPFAAVSDEVRSFYGVQFHPEVVHTPNGTKLLKNFTHKISECRSNWTMDSFKKVAIENIRTQVGKGKVICGLSGG